MHFHTLFLDIEREQSDGENNTQVYLKFSTLTVLGGLSVYGHNGSKSMGRVLCVVRRYINVVLSRKDR